MGVTGSKKKILDGRVAKIAPNGKILAKAGN